MSTALARLAGTALFWKGLHLAGAKGIFLVRTLILARLLAPDDFGLLAIATVSVALLDRIIDLGMIPALVQRRDVEQRHYDVAWTIGVVRALAVCSFVLLAAPLVGSLFNEPRAVDIVRVLALRPLLDALASIKVAELTRNLRFRPLAGVGMSEALTNTLVSIALAPFLGVWGMVVGALAGSIGHVVASYICAPHVPRPVFDRTAARPLVQYGRWIFVTSVIVVTGNYMVDIAVSRTLGTSDLGLLFLAGKLAFLPLEIASEVVGVVAFPLYALLQSDVRQATKAFQKIVSGMAVVLLPSCGLLIALAPSIVEHLLGPQWNGTVPVIRLLTVVSIVGLLRYAIVPILKGLGQPQQVTLLELAQSLLVVALIWGLTSRYGLVGAALAWLVTFLGVTTLAGVLARRALHRPFAGLARPVVATACTTAVGALCAIAVDDTLSGLGGLLLAGLAFLVVTVSLLWSLDRRLGLGLAEDVSRLLPARAAQAYVS